MIGKLQTLWQWWVRLFSPTQELAPDDPFIGSYGVQCCRCKGFMDRDTGATVFPRTENGYKVAQFQTAKAANSWAAAHGWYVGDGTDHRCRVCLEKIKQGEDRGKTRGAIVRFTRSGGEWGLWE